MKRKRDSSPGLASGDDGEPPGAEFEVFLNFRGPDTRLSFTDCLYHAMEGAGVRVFRDEEEIHKGEEIGGELLHAIDSSKVYVTVFSRDYASSAWCLRELAHIVESSRGSSGKVILPIFYGVDASDVKLRTGLYDEALKKHEDRFGCDEVRRWKEALIKVAGIKGWDSKGKEEGAIIKHIVDEVLTRLKKRQRNLPDHLVGIHNHLEDVMCLLQEGSLDVRFVVIHGMGGIGKTTLAEAVFNRISHQFSARSFLSNVRESSQDDKLRELQWRLLSDILKFRPERIYDTNDGINMIKERFRHKKVLIVLDNVDKGNQLMKLAGKHDWFGPGSRIIITTRDISFLSINKGRQRDSDSIHHEEFYIYEMKEMPLNHALELFSNHAFRRDTPPHGYYNNIATKIVKTTGGLPLALKVIGSSLCYKSEAVWQDMLEKLMKMPHKEVHDILMISYEMLEYEQKQIFLDIACHMAGEKIDDAIFMWKSCEFFPNHAIDVLINMSLIKVVNNEKLWMHDQLKDLGREIVRRESIQFPGRRSRLWCPRLAMEVIRRKKGTEEIVALKLDGHSKSHNFTPEEFSKLENLRFLELDGGNFVGDFESLFSELRWLSWHNCPSEFQATNFCLSNLVILKISGSDIKNDWEGWSQIMGTSNLKVLSLLSCKSLIKMPDFSMCSTLERLVLKDCESLVEIDPSIGNQEHLQYLEISGCNRLGSFLEEASSEISPCVVPQFLPDSMGSLQFLTTLKMEDLALLKLPNSIGELACLQCLSLSECPNLSKLPNSVGKLRSLVELDLSYTGLTELPDSIGELRRMKVINMTMSKIRKIPKAIGMVEQLEELHAFSCDLEGEIPSEIGALSSLKILNLGFTRVGGVPTTIDQLSQLEVLRLDACHELRQLPKLPASLTCLEFMSSSLENIPDLSNLTNLVDLILSDVRPENSFGYGYCETFDVCTEYSSQAPNLSWIGRLSKLQSLTLDLTNITVVPPELNSLSGLQELELPCSDLKSLAQLPPDLQFLTLKGFGSTLELSHLHNFKNLSRLILSRSWLTEILLDGLGQLENLRELRVSWCKALEKISGLSRLTQLRDFKVISCPRLVEIQGLDQSKSLEHIYLHRCDSTTELPDLLNLPKLGTLEISQCGLGSLPAVANNEICYLKIYKCRMLRNFRGTYQCYFNQSQDDPSSHLSTRQ